MPSELSAGLLLDACDHARLLDRASFEPLADLARAEALQTGIAVARLARGERPVGYKIGFTNRAIWARYGVFHPIWAPVWNTTLHEASGPVEVDSRRYAQPRLEPEIVVGLRETPAQDTPEAVLAAAEWIAHGFEIVQCPYPDWRFTAAEAIAAQGLHGMLIVGRRCPVSSLGVAPAAQAAGGRAKSTRSAEVPPAGALEALAACEIDLCCDGRSVERGCGANALDGPMHAIAHLARELHLRGHSIEAGSMIATGTLTDAQPLRAGQNWSTRVAGIELPGLELRVR